MFDKVPAWTLEHWYRIKQSVERTKTMGNKPRISFCERGISDLLLNLYLAVIMAVLAYEIYYGAKAGQPIAFLMSGFVAGISFMIAGAELFKYFFMPDTFQTASFDKPPNISSTCQNPNGGN